MPNSSKKSTGKLKDTQAKILYPKFLTPAVEKAMEKLKEDLIKNTDFDLRRVKKSRTVRGRRQPKKGTKKLQTKYESSRTFEYETIAYWKDFFKSLGIFGVVFRRPVSQSPADVWAISKHTKYLTQCKSSLDTIPPKKDKQEEEKFIKYCQELGTFCLWATRWKKNKNVYIRKLESYDFAGEGWIVITDDFSSRI